MIVMSDRLEKQGMNKFIALKESERDENPEYEVLDLSIGEPPSGPGQNICRMLFEEALVPENRLYADNGNIKFAETAGTYFRETYNCKKTGLDFLPVIGAKSALAMIPAAFINPGDYCIMPDPAYPVLGTWSRYLGGNVFNIHLTQKNNYYPDFQNIPADICRKAKLFYLNYPNNPTGQIAGIDFFHAAVDFARSWNILVIQDCAYGEILRPGTNPLSIFSVSGSEKCCIEIHSLSKTRNMTGWRIGFAAGTREILEPLRIIKSNTDSGQFIPIQLAAAQALSGRGLIDRMNLLYTERLEKTSEILNRTGLKAAVPPGTFYLYIPVPKNEKSGASFNSADGFCIFLKKKTNIIAIPWGDHFRLSLTFPEKESGDGWFYRELERRLGGFRFSGNME